MWVFLSNVARIILFLDFGIQSRCRKKNTLITMVGPTVRVSGGNSDLEAIVTT